MLFAALAFDRMPLQLSQLPAGIGMYMQVVGTLAAFAIALVLLARTLQRDASDTRFWNLSSPQVLAVLKYCVLASAAGYILMTLLWLGAWAGIGMLRTREAQLAMRWIFTVSGALALGVVSTPLAIDLCTRISWGRIWAIARLSWKEAVRGRIIWVFGVLSLVCLFAEWFLPYKPENQIRTYVNVVYWSMTVLFLVTAALLGSFSIPNDVNNSSIHTIVTKPVEKFEIVLGRFLGYAALLTVGLFVVSVLGLIYVERGVNEEAQNESYKARVPLYGKLHFAGTKQADRADSVGREWGYRSYITGPTRHRTEAFRQFAIWDFAEIPSAVMTQQVPIVFEYSFDIFRLSKGEEGKGVACTFTLVDVGKLASDDPNRQSQELETRLDELRKKRDKDHTPINEKYDGIKTTMDQEFIRSQSGRDDAADKKRSEQYKADAKDLKDRQDAELAAKDLELVEEFGIYQERAQQVTDQHTQRFEVPEKFFQALVAASIKRPPAKDRPPLALRAFISVDMSDQSQMVGVAQQDFYLLAAEKPFWQNFLKGVIGMWCTHMLVLGVALAMSTYFSSVISLLSTFFLYIAGLSIDYLKEVAEGRVDGGGPLESLMRIGTGMAVAKKLEPSPTTTLVHSFDSVFSWWIGFVLNLVPDLSRHDLHPYVADGFDIGWVDPLLVDNVLPLFGYLLPCAIMAYYLMKFREIANPT
jgi:hypothetical protein